MLWLPSAAAADLAPAMNKTNHTHTTTLRHRSPSLAVESGVGINDPGLSF
jgi:hypothetical protein